MSVADQARDAGLHRVGARPALRAYLEQTWQRRAFITTLARFRLRAANETNRLGIVWIGLRPCINAAIYGFVFGVLQAGRRPPSFVEFVVVGIFLFEFFSGSMMQGARSITGHRALVQSLAFPRITLPLAAVIEQFLSLLIMLGVMIVVVWANPGGTLFANWPRPSWLLLIPLVALYSLFNTGIALICARLTVHFTDLTQLLPYVSRLLMYLSGVLFQPEAIFASHPGVQVIFDAYPVYVVLHLGRSAMLPGYEAPSWYWLVLAAWAVGALLFGLVFFWAAEERYGRVL